MYIIKNALRNIARTKGKNMLLGCIALVIGLAACLALSIKEAAITEKENGLDNLSITASIEYDRQAMMDNMRSSSSENQDPREMMKNISSLSLEEMEIYAKADAVKEFYYTSSMSLNGNGLEAVANDTSSSNQPDGNAGFSGKGGSGAFRDITDFSITGYSSYSAMSDFMDGVKSIDTGELFDEETSDLVCIINKELATLNNVSLGDMINLVNSQNEADTYALKVVGIYTSNDTSQTQGGMMNLAMLDPANQIYMSYNTLKAIGDKSATVSEDTKLTTQVRGTYAFADVDDYEAFTDQARALGLTDEYTITSMDVLSYEQSLQPLESLSKYASYFLIVILIIGGCVLVVLNMYHIRERKYEIGVLAAIGMKKNKIAIQFISEIFVVTMVAILIGCGIGAVSSIPVTNVLLSTQSTSTDSQEQGFAGMKKMGSADGQKGDHMGFMNPDQEVITNVNSAADISVILQLIGIGIILTILAGGSSVLAILRYEPLKILSNRE